MPGSVHRSDAEKLALKGRQDHKAALNKRVAELMDEGRQTKIACLTAAGTAAHGLAWNDVNFDAGFLIPTLHQMLNQNMEVLVYSGDNVEVWKSASTGPNEKKLWVLAMVYRSQLTNYIKCGEAIQTMKNEQTKLLCVLDDVKEVKIDDMALTGLYPEFYKEVEGEMVGLTVDIHVILNEVIKLRLGALSEGSKHVSAWVVNTVTLEEDTYAPDELTGLVNGVAETINCLEGVVKRNFIHKHYTTSVGIGKVEASLNKYVELSVEIVSNPYVEAMGPLAMELSHHRTVVKHYWPLVLDERKELGVIRPVYAEYAPAPAPPKTKAPQVEDKDGAKVDGKPMDEFRFPDLLMTNQKNDLSIFVRSAACKKWVMNVLLVRFPELLMRENFKEDEEAYNQVTVDNIVTRFTRRLMNVNPAKALDVYNCIQTCNKEAMDFNRANVSDDSDIEPKYVYWEIKQQWDESWYTMHDLVQRNVFVGKKLEKKDLSASASQTPSGDTSD